MAALQSARRVEAPLAAATLLLVAVTLRSAPRRFPTWLDVGPITLPAPSSYPVPVALLVVVVVAVATYRRDGAVGAGRLLQAILASLTLLAAANAVVVLNNTSGGVFFAGMPPLVLGVLLCSVVLLEASIAAGRRVYAAAS